MNSTPTFYAINNLSHATGTMIVIKVILFKFGILIIIHLNAINGHCDQKQYVKLEQLQFIERAQGNMFIESQKCEQILTISE